MPLFLFIFHCRWRKNKFCIVVLFYQVEEIDDVDGSSCDPFVAAAIENEKELDLSEEQKKNFRKVINSSVVEIIA